MIVNLSAHAATVIQADDCTRLSVSSSLRGDELDKALQTTGSGRLREDGDVDLAVTRLHQYAIAESVGEDWPQRWQKMVDYAALHSWLSIDGEFLRAHIEAPR
ncbi:hypothetical protein [Nocardia asteroides]|uniref:hypothetical protein n=1 Tax=Nocardia asteroides TaxID=1824 RepID=UPI0034422630